MSFQKGQVVRWLMGPDPKATGAVETVLLPPVKTDNGGHWDTTVYVVRLSDGSVKLLGEGAVEAVETWVPCPGEHRPAVLEASGDEGVLITKTWERKDG